MIAESIVCYIYLGFLTDGGGCVC